MLLRLLALRRLFASFDFVSQDDRDMTASNSSFAFSFRRKSEPEKSGVKLPDEENFFINGYLIFGKFYLQHRKHPAWCPRVKSCMQNK